MTYVYKGWRISMDADFPGDTRRRAEYILPDVGRRVPFYARDLLAVQRQIDLIEARREVVKPITLAEVETRGFELAALQRVARWLKPVEWNEKFNVD